MARNLHELIGALPEFIEQMKIAEDQALEQHEIDEASSLINDGNLPQKSTILTEVFGKYHLESIYDLSHFFDTKDQSSQIAKGKYSKTCKVFKCQEQDDMDPQNEFHEMYAIVTNTCLLVLSPVRGTQFLAQLEFWATLQSLERIRRNMNNPNICACQWRVYEENRLPQVTVLKIGESKEQIDDFI